MKDVLGCGGRRGWRRRELPVQLSREVWRGFGNDAGGEVVIGTVSRERSVAHASVG